MNLDITSLIGRKSEKANMNLVKKSTKFLKERVLMNPIIKTINGPVVHAKNARNLKIR